MTPPRIRFTSPEAEFIEPLFEEPLLSDYNHPTGMETSTQIAKKGPLPSAQHYIFWELSRGCTPATHSMYPPFVGNSMSPISSPIPLSSSSEILLGATLASYTKRTEIDLVKDPLTIRVGTCDTPNAILDVLLEQALTFEELKNDDAKLTMCLRLIIDHLHVFSANHAIGDNASVVSLEVRYP
jgi:hypothetical protein